MPCRGRKFINEFLLPNLDEKKFGSRLKWLNIEESVFQLQWNHKSAAHWKETDAEVFIEWDKMKGHYRPDEKEYYTKSKQRFRAVLYKLIRDDQITEICCKDKSTKIYCIGKREKCELENIMSFKFHPPQSYSVENPVDSVIEDHRYSQSEQVSENEDDMLSLYPIQPCSLYSPPKSICQNIDPIDEKPFDYHEQFMQPSQLPLYVNFTNEPLFLESYNLLPKVDGNAFMYETANTTPSSFPTPEMLGNFDELYSHYT